MRTCYLPFILVCCSPACLGNQIDSDSLKNELKKNHQDSVKVNMLIMLSEARTVRNDSAYVYANEALRLALRINYTVGIAGSYRSLIAFARDKKEIDSLVEMSRAYFRKSSNPNAEWLAILKASGRYLILGNNILTAFRYANLFLENYDNMNDPMSYAVAWNIIGEAHRFSKNYDKAVEAYHNSIRYAGSNRGIGFLSPRINIGTVYLERGHLDSAMNRYDFIEDDLTRAHEEVSNTFAYIKYRKAQVFLAQKNFDYALREANASLALYSRLSHVEGKILALSVLNELFFEQQDYRTAVSHGTKAIDLALETDYFINNVDRVCDIVSKSFFHLNDLKNAYRYSEIENNIQDKLFNPSQSSAMTNALLELENGRHILELQLSRRQKEADELRLRQQRMISTLSLLGLLIVVGASFLLYRNARMKHKLNLRLKEKQNEIMAQTEELAAQAEELKATNEEMEAINSNLEGIVNERTEVIRQQNSILREYAYFNAHQVRGPLARILGLISIIELEFTDDRFRSYITMLKTSGSELDRVIGEINAVFDSEQK